MSSDSDDEEAGQTWISIRSLKQAASIKTAYHAHNEGEVSAHSSLNTSVTAESAPNLAINVSPSFSSLHESYLGLQTSHLKVSPLPSHSRYSSSSTNQMLTRRAQEEALELQAELLTTKRELQQVQRQLAVQEQQHAIHLQMIQAHHERKMLKHRQDMEEFLERQPETTVAKMKKEYEAEVSQICREFQARSDSLKEECECTLRKKEDKFAEEFEKLRKKMQEEAEKKENCLIQSHKAELEMLKKHHELAIQQLTKPEKSLKITTFCDIQIASAFSPSTSLPKSRKCEKSPEIALPEKADLEGLQLPIELQPAPVSLAQSDSELEQIISRIE